MGAAMKDREVAQWMDAAYRQGVKEGRESVTRALSHSTGDDEGGCVACQDEATNAYLNDEDMVPSCETPTDDGEGFCAVCGHRVGVAR